jgi:hypothetical protein
MSRRTGTRRSMLMRPAIRSSGRGEPGEDWLWCYVDELLFTLGSQG